MINGTSGGIGGIEGELLDDDDDDEDHELAPELDRGVRDADRDEVWRRARAIAEPAIEAIFLGAATFAAVAAAWHGAKRKAARRRRREGRR